MSTLDAAALCKMADRGQIVGGVLDGPLAFDNAISVVAARTKGIAGDVLGGEAVRLHRGDYDAVVERADEPVALAVRAGADLPTGADGLSAGRAGFHAIAIAGWQAARVNVNANLAYAHVNQPGARPNLFGASVAVVGRTALLASRVRLKSLRMPMVGTMRSPRKKPWSEV